jgi:hypothetical protein
VNRSSSMSEGKSGSALPANEGRRAGSIGGVDPGCEIGSRASVFARHDKGGRNVPIKKMYGTAWKNARKRAADAWERSHGTPWHSAVAR